MRRWTGWPPGRNGIEDALAARHLAGGTLVLYDVSSAAFEGRTCPLGAIGHPKDGVHGPAADRLRAAHLARRASRSRSRCSRATPATPRPSPPRSPRSRTGSGSPRVVPGRRPGHADRRAAARRRRPRAAGLDHRAARPAGQHAGPRRRAAAHLVRRAGPGRDHPPRTTPASGWSPARTRSWKPSAPASGKRCWPPPRPTWTRSPPPARGPGGRCAAKTRSRVRADRALRRRKVGKHFTTEHRRRSLQLRP